MLTKVSQKRRLSFSTGLVTAQQTPESYFVKEVITLEETLRISKSYFLRKIFMSTAERKRLVSGFLLLAYPYL